MSPTALTFRAHSPSPVFSLQNAACRSGGYCAGASASAHHLAAPPSLNKATLPLWSAYQQRRNVILGCEDVRTSPASAISRPNLRCVPPVYGQSHLPRRFIPQPSPVYRQCTASERPVALTVAKSIPDQRVDRSPAAGRCRTGAPVCQPECVGDRFIDSPNLRSSLRLLRRNTP